jgi:hypothetical protein
VRFLYSRSFYYSKSMIEKNTYRLGEYLIKEYDDNALRWTAHHGFGEQWSGKCFILDDILVLEEFTHEEIGYLKGEFLDRIRKLPVWNKTRFYCFASDLSDVSSGRSPSRDWWDCIPLTQELAQLPKDRTPGVFRLDKYKIAVAETRQISWQTLEGGERVVGGQCTVQSGILLIGPKEYETEGQTRQQFFSELNAAAPWRGTGIWSHGLALRPCESPSQIKQMNTFRQRDTWRDHTYRENRSSSLGKEGKKTLRSVRPPQLSFKAFSLPRLRFRASFKLPKLSWSLRSRKEIRFLLLIPLLVAGLILGLIFGLHSLKEGSHHHHSSEKYHHK